MFFLIMFKNKNLIDINIPYINMPVNHSAKIQSKWKVNFEAFLVYNTWRCLPTLRDGSITQTHTRPLRIFPSPLGRKHTTPRWLQKTKQHSKSSRHGFGCWSWFWFVPLKGRKEELETCSEQIDRKLQFGWQRRRSSGAAKVTWVTWAPHTRESAQRRRSCRRILTLFTLLHPPTFSKQDSSGTALVLN